MTKAKVGGRVQQRSLVGGGSFVVEGIYENRALSDAVPPKALYTMAAYKLLSRMSSWLWLDGARIGRGGSTAGWSEVIVNQDPRIP